MKASRRAAVILALAVAAAPGVRAQPAADGTASLGRGVPSDAAVYVHLRMDVNGPFWKRLGWVREAISSSGFGDRFREGLLAAAYGEAEGSAAERNAALRKRLESEMTEWQRAAAAVDWWSLLERESVIAARPSGERLDWLFLARIDPGAREELVASFRRLLHILCSAGRDLEVLGSSREREFLSILYRTPEAEPGSEKAIEVLYQALRALLGEGLEISVAARDDVLLLATSRSLLARSLQLLGGKGSDLGYSDTARRADLMAKLPPLPTTLPGLPAPGAASPVPGLPTTLPGAEAAALEVHLRPAAVFPGVPAAAGIESFVLSGTADGKSFAYAYRAEPGGEGRKGSEASRAAFFARPAAADLLKWVPADARSFHVTSGAEPRAVIELAGAAIAGLVPASLRSASGVEEWTELARELAGHLTGRRVLLSDENGGWILLCEPAPSFRWHAALSPLVESALRLLAGEVSSRDVDGGAGQVFRFSAAKTRLACIVGYAKGAFFIGSSEVLLDRSLAAGSGTASGEDRLKAAGPALPPGELLRAGESRPAPVLSFAAGAFAHLAREAASRLVEREDAFAKALLAALPRLAPAIEALGFLESLSSRRVRAADSILGAGTVTFGDARTPRKEF